MPSYFPLVKTVVLKKTRRKAPTRRPRYYRHFEEPFEIAVVFYPCGSVCDIADQLLAVMRAVPKSMLMMHTSLAVRASRLLAEVFVLDALFFALRGRSETEI